MPRFKVAKRADKIEVRSSEEGKLYIYISDLFALPSVQHLIDRVAESKALEGVNKVELKEGNGG
jgi:hypothetical protein